MKIPDEVKIGGITYVVEVTDRLSMGQGYAGEIDYEQCEIRIKPMNEQKMYETFLHECVHGMLAALGYTEHDELLVEGLANQMQAFIVDNKEV